MSAHAETATLDWSDLIDQSVQSFEDPFRDLTYKQIDALRRVAKFQAELESADATEEAQTATKAQLEEARAALAETGIDADWLISQRWIVAERRELASTAGNPAYDDETVTLGGFAIPAPPDEDGSSVAYLVPERGMCSHMPPPPPNQMVQLRLNDDWQPSTVYEPIAVSGRIRIAPSEREMLVVDGFVPMRATFTMDVTSVQTFSQPKAASDSTNDWADGLVEQL